MPDIKFSKKVLVISNFAPPASGGSPHVIYNLFKNYDPESYVFYTHEKNVLSGDMRRKLRCRYYTYAPSRNTRFKFFGHFIAFMRALSSGLTIIRSEKIEVLLGTADKGTALLLTLILSLLSRKPHALYMLDPYRGTDFTPLRKMLSTVLEPLFFTFARVVVTTNDGHRDYYRKIYGDKFRYSVLYHASSPQKLISSNGKSDVTFLTILYTGSIYYAQEKSIQNLINAVEDMHDLSIRILLYVPKHDETVRRMYLNHSCVSVHRGTPEEMPAIQQQADILFLPLAWGLSEGIARMAIPGKTPEYLVAGKPILVHAPPQAYLCEYARKEKFACVVDTEDIETLKTAVRTLLTDQSYAASLVSNARHTFAHYHDDIQNSIRFAEILKEL